MLLTITRPKDVSLEELFELRLRAAPKLGGSPVMPEQFIVVGQRTAIWKCSEHCSVDGLFVYWPKRTQSWSFTGRIPRLAPGDTLHVTLTWDLT